MTITTTCGSRFSWACVLLGAFLQLPSVSVLAASPLDRPITLDIPPNTPIDDALIEWGTKVGVTVMINTSVVEHLTTKGIHGTQRADVMLSMILRGSGLSYTAEGGRIRVAPVATLVRSAEREEEQRVPGANSDSGTQTNTASVNSDANKFEMVADNTPNDTRRTGLEEVIVSAQKREERLQDVPIPVTAISAQILLDQNQLRLQDYYTSVPGLSVLAGNSPSSDTSSISIRGITTGPFSNPSVGITVDDVPFGSSDSYGGGNLLPDFDPSDLARVEVLRGPQGTLYGASSLGGLIKFVTVDPSTAGVSGHIEAGTSSVYNGAELGYNFRGAVNVPLSDTLAVRASAFTREDPGYVDNRVTHIDGVNESYVSGGRVAALWAPSKDFSLKLSALYQDFKADGVSDADTALGTLRQNYLRGTGKAEGTLQAYSATASGKIGDINLIALSGYNIREGQSSADYSPIFGSLVQPLYGVSGAELFTKFETKKFSQEIRLSAPIGESFDWLLGAFYTHEDSSEVQTITANNSTSGTVVADAYYAATPSTYSEYAGFADLTVHFTDRFDVQFGGRGGSIKQVFPATTTIDPLFTGGSTSPQYGMTARASSNPVTYLLTPRFKVSSDLMVYGRIASGYRPGGPNALCVVNNVQCEFSPDKTQNYELGAKGDFLDHILTFDASIYYIDWKNIQLTAINSHYIGFNTNASKAKSQGVELSVESRPVTDLTITAWVDYDDALLTGSFPADVSAYGVAGDRLPYTSRFSGNFSVDEEFHLSGSVTGFVGGAVSYVGDRLASFRGSYGAPAPRQDLPGYARTDLRAGVRYDSWTVKAFSNNVFDKRGIIDGGLGFSPPTTFLYIQPRTIGLSVSKVF